LQQHQDLLAELGVEEAAEWGGAGGGERREEELADPQEDFEELGAEFGGEQVFAAGEGAGEGDEELLLGHALDLVRRATEEGVVVGLPVAAVVVGGDGGPAFGGGGVAAAVAGVDGRVVVTMGDEPVAGRAGVVEREEAGHSFEVVTLLV